MKRKTQLFLESMNSFLNEARNPANDRVNALLRDPIKNKEEIEKMGYKIDDRGNVINPKTNRIYNYNEFGDSYAANRNRSTYDDEYSILKGGKAGKDFDAKNYLDTNRDNDEAYLYSINKHKGKRDRVSKNKGKDYSQNPAENIYKYKQAVRQRDRAQGDYDKAMSTANDIKSDLDNAEKKRQEILNKARQRRINKESSINEDSNLTEARSNKEANEKAAPRTQLPTWPVKYKNGVHSNAINVGGRKENLMFDDLSNGKSSIQRYKDSKEQADIARKRASEFDKKAKDIAKEEINKLKNRKTNESALTEAGLANLKTIDDFSDIDEFHEALEDDKNTISNSLEDLKPKMNLKGSVDLINSFKDQMIKQISLYNEK